QTFDALIFKSVIFFFLLVSIQMSQWVILKLFQDSKLTPVRQFFKTESQNSHNKRNPIGDANTSVLQGDIAVPNTLSRNADKCTERGCKWPKSGSYVYVPYYISKTFSQEERDVIIRGMQGFNQSTCIRLIPWKPEDRDYIFIESKDGCWSYVGRQNGGQYLSLQKTGCVHNEVVQHEILHALGFNHEQVRSDRDSYVRILFDNIEPNFKFAFEKKETNNLGTPYDFTSVMEYRNDAFSKNGKPTIVAKCDPNLKFGNSKKMSANDIIRINKLYECSE
uniref:Metalloendopeptidase n=1 Tax=Xiphophorus maculatus TaxID=8083 RepID=A0A3B5R428_XIPMA